MTLKWKYRSLKSPKSSRSRIKNERYNSSTKKWDQLGTSVPSTTHKGYTGSQKTGSEGHLWPPTQGDRRDVGGDFYTEKRTVSQPHATHSGVDEVPVSQGPYTRWRFTYSHQLSCPIETSGDNPKWPTPQNSSNSNLNALGATAISRVRPTASAAELSVALGETYKDGLPALAGHRTWRERTLAARNAGDEYLNVQFGWLPLVNDVAKFGRAVGSSDSILKQYDADRGKVIRRQYDFPVERSSSEEILSLNTNPVGYGGDTWSPGMGVTKGGVWTRSTTTTIRRWFSGAFVYGHPFGLDTKSKFGDMAAKADKLYGISLTPDVLWNLSPWSWAIDWFTNVGDVLSTVSDMASQGLVMQYGYLMETTVREYKYNLRGATYHGKTVVVPSATVTTVTKSRTRANPFGFGLTWDGLSSSQLAILSALGISRS